MSQVWNIEDAFNAVVAHARCDDYDVCADCPMEFFEKNSDYTCSELARSAARCLEEWKNKLSYGVSFENLTLDDLI